MVLALSLWVGLQRRHAILAERRVGSWYGVGGVAVGMLVCLAGLGIAGFGWHAMRRNRTVITNGPSEMVT